MKNIKWIINEIQEFGLLVTLSATLNKCYKYGPHTNKVAYNINIWKHNCIKKCLRKKFAHIIGRYKTEQEPHTHEYLRPQVLWTIWWQGEDKAPEAIKLCFQSMRKYSNGHEVIVISKINYRKYVQLPEYILEKVELGIISLTHLADILRMYLLYYHGGIWLDATIFFTAPIDSTIFLQDYFTGKLHRLRMACVSEGRWNGTFLAGKPGNVFFDYMINFYNEYWQKENQVIDYFLIDYMTDIAYEDIPVFKKQLDAVPYNNENIFIMNQFLNKVFNKEIYEEIIDSTSVHKIQRRNKYSKVDSNGNLTFYGYITKLMINNNNVELM